MIFPSFPNQGMRDPNWHKKFPSFAVNSLHEGKGPDIDFFDVEIDQDILNSVEITLGPLCPPGKKLIVNALIERYTSNGKVKDSNLKGTIRTPKR